MAKLKRANPDKSWNELTFQEKLADIKDQFQYENCHECGKGFAAHDVFDVLGNPFLKCRGSR